MKTAVITDVHANLEALEAVLDHTRDAGVEDVVCLGDVVGYNADPAACIDRLRALPRLRCVLGNHDAMAVGEGPLQGISDQARLAMEWTRDRLDAERRAWLAGLPLVLRDDDAVYCHASLDDPPAWRYVLSPLHAAGHLAHQDRRLGFVGHSHRAFAWREAGPDLAQPPGPVYDTASGDRWLVSVGSAGQPRDGDPRAGYVLFDRATGRVEQLRVAYDVAAAQAKILAAGLPPMLAERLG